MGCLCFVSLFLCVCRSVAHQQLLYDILGTGTSRSIAAQCMHWHHDACRLRYQSGNHYLLGAWLQHDRSRQAGYSRVRAYPLWSGR
jgi:hypothetical protein